MLLSALLYLTIQLECDQNELTAACEGASYPTAIVDCKDGWMGLAFYHMGCTSQLNSSAISSGEVCYNGTAPGSVAAYKCNTGFQFEHNSSTYNRSCLSNGLWNSVPMVCIPVPSKSKSPFLFVIFCII